MQISPSNSVIRIAQLINDKEEILIVSTRMLSITLKWIHFIKNGRIQCVKFLTWTSCCGNISVAQLLEYILAADLSIKRIQVITFTEPYVVGAKSIY